MNLLRNFQQFIQSENLFQRTDTLLLAVSGGVDSAVLCELCKQSKFSFIIAHCNFQLRGEESTRDEHFVCSLAEKYKVPLLVKIFDTERYAADNKFSIQVAARVLRYEWFDEILNGNNVSGSRGIHPSGNYEFSVKPGYLLTAHHADDNIETMLMNFFKGTGITGLRAILPKQKKIVRPLLFAHKHEIIEFAKKQ